jgi:hypothetical protein
MTASFNFGTLNIELHVFTRNETNWKMLSIDGRYDFYKITVGQSEFTEGHSYSGRNEKVYSFSVYRIARHVLMKQFTVRVSYELEGCKDVFNAKFSFEVRRRRNRRFSVDTKPFSGSILPTEYSSAVQVP